MTHNHSNHDELNSGALLMDGSEARTWVAQRLDSHDWWGFPLVGDNAQAFIEMVEGAHYSGEANGDFQLLIGGIPQLEELGIRTLGIVFAHKRRMDVDSLVALLKEAGDEEAQAHVEALKSGQDILFVLDPAKGQR